MTCFRVPRLSWVLLALSACATLTTCTTSSCVICQWGRDIAGGIPEKAALVAEAAQHWRPPPPWREGRRGAGPAMGQVAGVAKGHRGSVWVLHRAGRTWDGGSFEGGGAGERTLLTETVAEDVVLQLDQETGALLCMRAQSPL